MLRYAATIFISAFLLFLVQPLIGKYILPWFGGGSGVWTACLLFFQCVLLAGYFYAHILATKFTPRTQMIIHVIVLAAGLAFLPIVPREVFKPIDASQPVLRIVILLAATIGLPYLALSATGPLLQAWFARTEPNRSPYRLYALSNFGSLLALLGYPFLMEPALQRAVQANAWSIGFGAFAVLCGWCSIAQARGPNAVAAINPTIEPSPRPSPLPDRRVRASAAGQGRGGKIAEVPAPVQERVVTRFDRALWVIMPMCASIMLLAATSQISEEIAPMPFVWVLPLAIYLISFIIAFEWPRLYDRRFFAALAIGVPWLYLAVLIDTHAGIVWQASLYLIVLFACCMICHGEVYRLRPPPRKLTSFYLALSFGGALGGVFVSIIAPLIFTFNLEIYLAIFGSLALLAICLARDPVSPFFKGANRQAWLGIVLVIMVAAFLISNAAMAQHKNAVDMKRSFYGSLVVREIYDNSRLTGFRKLFHGRICHGSQSLRESERYLPLMYYSPSSGVGIVMRTYLADQPRSIGVVGLGTGALAAWADADDVMRFYEISPQIEDVAREHFTFLQDCRGKTEVVMGDARLSMEREPPQQYDILVLDAFSGDAVPTHLLTREAFEVYKKHLKPDGVIAVNVTNRYLELHPLVHRVAFDAGMDAARVITIALNPEMVSDAHWMVVSANKEFLATSEIAAANEQPPVPPSIQPWTDDYCSILPFLRR